MSTNIALDRPVVPVSSEDIASLELFRDLTGEERAQVASVVTLLSLKGGEYLFRAGEPYRKLVFIVLRGWVEQSWPSGGSDILGPGHFIGLSSAVQASSYATTARTLSSAVVLAAPADNLQQLEETCRPLANVAHRVIAERVRHRGAARHATSRALSVPCRSLMKSPLVTCGTDVTLSEGFRIMDERKIGSLGVTDTNGRLIGVLTYAGLSKAVLVDGARPEDNIMQVGCEEPRLVRPEAPVWEVEEILQDPAVKYVIVAEDGWPLGMISQTDVLKHLIAQQGLIYAEITRATDFTELVIQRRRLVSLASEALEQNREASAAVRFISEFHLALQRRCAELTYEEMEREGLRPPAVPFALIIMGSGARKEMMLNPDQDNGLIIADVPEATTKKAKKWFQSFSERVNQHLDELGYALCAGNIMARNPDFQKSLEQWKKQFSHVISQPTEKAARWAHVMLDFDTLYGDGGLTIELRNHVFSTLKENSRLLTMMVKDDSEGGPPIGLFNRLITLAEPDPEPEYKHKGKNKKRKDQGKKDKIDIKRNGLRILADAARIYALSAGIRMRNTRARLNSLVRQGVLSREAVASAEEAYETLMAMLLTHQIQQMERGEGPDKLVRPKKLTIIEHETLRMAMLVIKRFQQKLQADFGTVTF